MTFIFFCEIDLNRVWRTTNVLLFLGLSRLTAQFAFAWLGSFGRLSENENNNAPQPKLRGVSDIPLSLVVWCPALLLRRLSERVAELRVDRALLRGPDAPRGARRFEPDRGGRVLLNEERS